MIEVLVPWIGAGAAVLTSLSYVPQVRKAWPRGSTADLSLKMLIALTSGLLLWIVYGFLKSDWVIVAANSGRDPVRQRAGLQNSRHAGWNITRLVNVRSATQVRCLLISRNLTPAKMLIA